jgi:hypothetical protein
MPVITEVRAREILDSRGNPRLARQPDHRGGRPARRRHARARRHPGGRVHRQA